MIWVLQELIYHEIVEAKPYKLAYDDYDSVSKD